MNQFKSRFLNRQMFYRSLIFIVSLVIFILLMDKVVMPVYTKHGEEYQLPDVTTKPLEEAVEILQSRGFNPVIKDSVFDFVYPAGSVIRQTPLPQSTVKEGRRVYLVVSIGDKPIYMPNLIGKTPQDAEFLLRERNLELNNVIYEFSDFYHRGVVINQSVPPSSVVNREQKINLTVSLGPQPNSQEVPNLKGKSLENARHILQTIGIQIGEIDYELRQNLVPGTVLSQSVSPGTPVESLESINLVVSTDRPIIEETPDEQF